MILEAFHIRNFRRLRDVHVTLEPDRTIFVGANNSGKTSAAQVLSLFLKEGKFLMYDFSAEAWKKFDEMEQRSAENADAPLPSISLDLWFQITATDLHRVIELVPMLDLRAAVRTQADTGGLILATIPGVRNAAILQCSEVKNREEDLLW